MDTRVTDTGALTRTVNDYLANGIHTIKGWCGASLWNAIWPLRELTGPGPVAEIGVYHGKFFVGLATTFGVDQPHVAIDVFDLQEFNLDNAGEADLDIFTGHCKRFGIDDISLMERDSLALNHRDVASVVDRTDGVVCFSVDGCHTVTHTMNDIEFAMNVTRQSGLIFVDDYTNPNWPGVMEAVARLYLFGSPRFVPLAMTTNKLILCGYGYHETYVQHLLKSLKDGETKARFKKVTRFGYDTVTIQPNSVDAPVLKPF